MAGPAVCTVSFVGEDGVRHSVEVAAGSLNEAVCRGVAALREAGIEPPTGVKDEMTVEVRPASIATHVVSFATVRAWLKRTGRSPREQALKSTLEKLLEEDRAC